MDLKREQYVANGEPLRWSRFISSHPMVFVLLVTVGFIAAVRLASLGLGWFGMSLLNNIWTFSGPGTEALELGRAELAAKTFLSVVATGLLLLFGWWRSAGFTPPREWHISPRLLWLPALILLVTLGGSTFAGLYNFSNPAWSTMAVLETLLVGFEEEVFFRGVILFGLLWAWRNRPRGSLWAVLLSSALFGLQHVQNTLFAGDAIGDTATQMILTFFMGLGLAGLVLRTNSLWLAVVWHGLWNMFITGFRASPDLLAAEEPGWFGVTSALFLVSFGIYGLYLIRPYKRRARTTASPR